MGENGSKQATSITERWALPVEDELELVNRTEAEETEGETENDE